MKKFFLKILLIALLAWGLQYLTVWYAGPLMALAVNLFWKGSPSQGFFTGFLGLGLLWLALVLYTDMHTGSILSTKMASILPLKGNVTLLIAITSLIGGLTGGLCGWLGAEARALKN